MKQTAVEWLGNEITNRITRRNPHDTIIIQTLGERLIELIEQAKEMEKEQIIDAFEIGYENGACVNQGESIYHGHNYYKETFKSE
jgi:hypothetical protein